MCSKSSEDLAEDYEQFGRVKDWINSYHLKTVELTDVLSKFSKVSEALLKEILNKFVMEGFLSKAGANSYVINKQEGFSFTSIIGMSGKDYDVLAVESRVSILVNGKWETLHDNADKMINLFDCVFASGTGPMKYFEKVQKELPVEFKKLFPHSYSIIGKCIDEIADIVAHLIDEILRPKHVNHKDPVDKISFVLVGAIKTTRDRFSRSTHGLFDIHIDGDYRNFIAVKAKEKIITRGMGAKYLDEYLQEHVENIFLCYMDAGRYCRDCIAYATLKDKTSGGNIQVVEVDGREFGSNHMTTYKKKVIDGKLKFETVGVSK